MPCVNIVYFKTFPLLKTSHNVNVILPAKLFADQVIVVLEGVGPYPRANICDHSASLHHCAFCFYSPAAG